MDVNELNGNCQLDSSLGYDLYVRMASSAWSSIETKYLYVREINGQSFPEAGTENEASEFKIADVCGGFGAGISPGGAQLGLSFLIQASVNDQYLHMRNSQLLLVSAMTCSDSHLNFYQNLGQSLSGGSSCPQGYTAQLNTNENNDESYNVIGKTNTYFSTTNLNLVTGFANPTTEDPDQVYFQFCYAKSLADCVITTDNVLPTVCLS